MTDRAHSIVRRIIPRRVVSPGGFLWAAIALCLLYAVCHGLGWRAHTGFLSGNVGEGGRAETDLLAGVVYVVAYFGFALAAPILGLASAFFAVLLRVCRRH